MIQRESDNFDSSDDFLDSVDALFSEDSGFSEDSDNSSSPERPALLKKSRLIKILCLAFAGLLLFAVTIFVIFGNSTTHNAGDPVRISIPSGTSGAKIADILEHNGVINDKRSFIDLLIAQKISLRAGVYKLRKGMPAHDAISALLDPDNRINNTVVIPEGSKLTDIFKILSQKTGIPIGDFEKVTSDLSNFPNLPKQAKSVEGFLFPATYDVEDGSTAKSLLSAMYKRMWEEIRALEITPQKLWETVVLAALVQAEGIPQDFGRVSRVFLNRLDRDMPLQSDATILYYLKITGDVVTSDKQREDASNPYNTYIHKGLPPGPISNPGSAALKAALHPANGKWLFFVTWNECTGETIFSETFSEHQAGVNKWLKWRKEHPNGC